MIPKKPMPVVLYVALEALRNIIVWAPLAIYFGLRIIMMFVYLLTIRGALSSGWTAFTDAQLSEAVRHYPWNLTLMPLLLSRLDLPLDVLVHAFFQGSTVVLLAAVMTGQRATLSEAFAATARRYGAVVLVALIGSGVLYLWFQLPVVFARYDVNLPSRIVKVGVLLGGLILQAFLVYALPLVLLHGRSALGSVRDSLSACARSFGRTFVIVALAFAITAPTLYLGLQSNLLVSRLSPEILIHIHIAQQLTAFVSTVVMLGAVTSVLVRRTR